MKYDRMRQVEFERVAMPHTETLLRAALRLTRNREGAEDMVQETLLRAWTAFEQFEHGTNCKAWLFRILLNISSKRRRRLRATPAIVTLDETQSKIVPFRAAPSQFEAVEVLSALDMLSKEHRIVLILMVVEGFTCKEIAGMCDLPLGTVMSRLSRARAELRKILDCSKYAGQSLIRKV
jgi:RNA polymerase sigma-70 factor, ECF subfamily